MAAETPAAPLDRAVEKARKALGEYETLCPMGVRTSARIYGALRSVLAALDADRGEAERLLRAIVDERHRCFIPTNIPEAPALMDWDERARRYFARRKEKGENRG